MDGLSLLALTLLLALDLIAAILWRAGHRPPASIRRVEREAKAALDLAATDYLRQTAQLYGVQTRRQQASTDRALAEWARRVYEQFIQNWRKNHEQSQ